MVMHSRTGRAEKLRLKVFKPRFKKNLVMNKKYFKISLVIP